MIQILQSLPPSPPLRTILNLVCYGLYEYQQIEPRRAFATVNLIFVTFAAVNSMVTFVKLSSVFSEPPYGFLWIIDTPIYINYWSQ